MTVGEICEQAVSMVKTVWQKRGDKVKRKEVSRLLATDAAPRPRKDIKVSSDGS